MILTYSEFMLMVTDAFFCLPDYHAVLDAGGEIRLIPPLDRLQLEMGLALSVPQIINEKTKKPRIFRRKILLDYGYDYEKYIDNLLQAFESIMQEIRDQFSFSFKVEVIEEPLEIEAAPLRLSVDE